MKLAFMVVLMVVLTLMIVAPVSADAIMARKGGGGGGGRGGKKPKPKGEKPDEPKTDCKAGSKKCGSGDNAEDFWLYDCNSAGSWEQGTDCTNGCVGGPNDPHCW
ncbi:hypothetical protein HBI56_112230 [Parastagonospora nodorum]|nr:hypothetical protein HBH53_131780 [Parastagonospora nodorum]KAH4038453.1 hypothetical protein HBI09_051510 [Parastagonospora nodorum]KAH4055489.1 hypothetical protein HBH49_059910 [Parastagonospora nodorum]KAH4102268.1 hypothetical protein HBH46_131280 [Parastagonospora nodorum]KAH4130415.1 hypothetical protein HBH47_025000 [Parastagonospora nodorum]